MTNKCIVVLGNLCEGFTFYGPYDDFDDAADSAEGSYSESWVANLEKPYTEENDDDDN